MTLSILKVTILKSSLLAAGCVVALVAFAANADDSSTSASPVPQQQRQGAHGGHHHGPYGGMHDPFLRAIHRLNLTADQEQRIHALFANARQQERSQRQQAHQGRPALGVLANPGDPDYPAAIQKSKTDAADRIQAHSDLDSQIYALLSDDQKTKLPQAIADMQTRMKHHHQKLAPPPAN